MDELWKQRVPPVINKQEFALTRLLKHCDIPRAESWKYIEFLFNSVEAPRNKTEAQIKKRYKLWHEQSRRLDLCSAQWVGCGEHKQVFALGDTVPPRVIKLFDKTKEWQREKDIYINTEYLLPHEYREHYATCDWVEMVNSKASLEHAINQSKINNRKFAKKVLDQYFSTNIYNFGFYQDKLVWIDIGNYVPI